MKSYIEEIHSNIKNKNKSINTVVQEYLNVIRKEDANIHAMLEIYDEAFINKQIAKAEEMFESGVETLLTGVPMVVKDNLAVDGQITSSGSKMLANYKATYNSTVVERLMGAGAIIVGRSNMDEFAMGSSTENSAFFKTLNPLDITRVPGGSSGGSAAVVAYNGVPVSIGTDTGGSIRQPAAFTGLVGLKPTYGEVSRYGLSAMGSSLDCPGPFAHSARDAEIVFDIIKGEDRMDATTIRDSEKKRSVNRKVIGVPKRFVDQDSVDSEIKDNFYKTLDDLQSLGYQIKEIDIKNIEATLSIYYILMFAEVSSNLARYDGVRYGYNELGGSPSENMIKSRSNGLGEEPVRRSLIGAYVLSAGYYDAYYNKAVKLREEFKNVLRKLFEDIDYIATPTSPVFAWKFGEKSDPLTMYLADIFTVPANIVGVPGISVPTGKASNGLSHGVQFLTSWHDETKLFEVAKDIEKIVTN